MLAELEDAGEYSDGDGVVIIGVNLHCLLYWYKSIPSCFANLFGQFQDRQCLEKAMNYLVCFGFKEKQTFSSHNMTTTIEKKMVKRSTMFQAS